jgi:hypothetical protein
VTDYSPIVITEPVVIRQYTIGGKGGTAASSTPLHRLTERRRDADYALCGMRLTGKIAVLAGPPKPKDSEKYGVCQRCWPEA